MNDRIRELARASGGIDMTNHVAGGTTTWVGTGTPEFLEKFAESIVRECAAIALREDHDPADCILAHFGLLDTAKPQRPSPLDSSYPDGDGYWK